MKTAVIQIGNSDDKLTQRDWSQFVKDLEFAVSASCGQVHFSGFSHGGEPWQNFCTVVEIYDDSGEGRLRGYLSKLVKKYRQESIALTIGETEFVPKKRQQKRPDCFGTQGKLAPHERAENDCMNCPYVNDCRSKLFDAVGEPHFCQCGNQPGIMFIDNLVCVHDAAKALVDAIDQADLREGVGDRVSIEKEALDSLRKALEAGP